ncbi:MAG TPA: nucleoid-associated protein [Lachnospiraceae bacterium]|nr:nucleoid-associated protein [Lachnospiraceae bacterium]
MYKEDIRIKKVIVHIMDTMVGMPILSETEIEYGSDFADFLKEHIFKIASGDDCKKCKFYEEQSEIYKMLIEYQEADFIENSKKMAEQLYDIMVKNVEIPPGDLMVVQFKVQDIEYLALLKMNFKESYTHRTMPLEEGNSNLIIKYKSILPTENQRLLEAAIINLQDMTIDLLEKKYEVNGEKTNYFSYLYLKCSSHLSHKSKLSIVTKAVESIQKDHYGEEEQYEQVLRAKSIINDTLTENGSFSVEEIASKIFSEKPTLVDSFQEKMEKYDLVKEEISPQSERTTRKYEKQFLITDTGIEIKIPMEQYKDPGRVEFITNSDGTISVVIKNIGHLKAKF